MKIESNLKPRDYFINEVVRIKDPKQYLLYIKNGVYPIDIYTSIDDKTNTAIIIMIFLKEETIELYQKWRNYELA